MSTDLMVFKLRDLWLSLKRSVAISAADLRINRREVEPGLEVTELADSFDLDSLDFEKRLVGLVEGEWAATAVAVAVVVVDVVVVVVALVEAAVRAEGTRRWMPRQRRYFSTVLIAASGSTFTGPPRKFNGL